MFRPSVAKWSAFDKACLGYFGGACASGGFSGGLGAALFINKDKSLNENVRNAMSGFGYGMLFGTIVGFSWPFILPAVGVSKMIEHNDKK